MVIEFLIFFVIAITALVLLMKKLHDMDRDTFNMVLFGEELARRMRNVNVTLPIVEEKLKDYKYTEIGSSWDTCEQKDRTAIMRELATEEVGERENEMTKKWGNAHMC